MKISTMKAAVSEGNGDIRIATVDMPQPGPYDCLCKMRAAATCSGTDQKILSNKLPWKLEYPGIVGHESIGIVLECGEKVRHIRQDEIYFRPTAVYAGQKLGGFTPITGGFAEYGLVTDVRAMREDGLKAPGYATFQMPLPAGCNLDPGDATMLITLKEVAGFIMNLAVTLNQPVVILGSGSVAMAMVFFAKLRGAFPLIVVGRRDEPLNYLRRFGANWLVNNSRENMLQRVRELTGGQGAELIIDTAGDDQLLLESLEMLSENGRLAPYATINRPAVMDEIAPERIVRAATGEVASHEYMFDLARMGLLDLKSYYSHRLPFAEIADGFALLKQKQASKVVFDF